MNFTLLSFLFVCYVIHQSDCFSVNCDDNGYCMVRLSTLNSTFYPQPGSLPPVPQKFITSLKNITTDLSYNVTLVSKPKGYSFGGNLQNSEFICADGIGECVNSCCNSGYCTDPLFICTKTEGDVKLIFMIVGLIFVAILISYWVYYFLLGVWYNAEIKYDTKTDDFYNKNVAVQKTEQDEIKQQNEEKMHSASRSSTNSKDHDNIVPFTREFNLKKNDLHGEEFESRRNNYLPNFDNKEIIPNHNEEINRETHKDIYKPPAYSNNTMIEQTSPIVESQKKTANEKKESRRKPAGIINEFEEKVLESKQDLEVKIAERPIIDFKGKVIEEEKEKSLNKEKLNKSEDNQKNDVEDI